jgi:beta-galactosidase
MTRNPRIASLIAAALLAATAASAQFTARQVTDFDPNWHFQQSDAPGAESPTFDDTHWQPIAVPHDWSIAGPIAQTNPSGQGGGFFPSGIAWYRKSFTLTPADAHKHAYIVFDGVMANSDVWINGTHLGHRPNGTVSFFYDLTGHLNAAPGSHNVLAVRTDTSQQPASRWYEGNGIYRKVRLVLLNDVHIAPWSTAVTTPVATAASATISVRTTVTNDSDTPATVALNLGLTLPDGSAIHTPIASKPTTVAPHTSADISLSFNLPHPKLWDIDAPNLHTLHVTLVSNKTPLDDDIVPFGIRESHFDPATGFWLNGRNLKLKGAALHIDGSAFGDAVPTAVYERRLLALRKLGVNAIRTAHNPPSPDFLDLCDRLGFLVMDEMFDAWTVGKNPYDYHLYFRDWALRDLHDTVLRDRNHPSIILWSAGNEIHDTPHPEVALPILKSLVAAFHAADPTRPVTQGLFRPNASHDYDDGLADLLDVIGQNYREQELLAAHAAKPTRKILGTENTHDRNQWLAMRDHPEYSGQFLWIGVDYLGEAGEHGGWPLFANSGGLLDRTLVAGARAFERQSWWSTTPTIHAARRIGPTDKVATDPGYENLPKSRQVLFPDWSPADRSPHSETVEVYTNAEEADLLLNGKSLGRQKLHPDASPIQWHVPFEPGTLTAVAYTAGKETARDELRTAGPAVSIRLIPEKPTLTTSPDDVLTLRAELLDANGTLVPDASNLLHVTVIGAQLRAIDTGNNTDHTPVQSPTRQAFQGHAIVLIQSTTPGPITITATAEGLKPATITTQSTNPTTTPPAHSF